MSKKNRITEFFTWLQSLLERILPATVARWLAIALTGALVAIAVAAGVLTLDSCTTSYRQNGVELRLELVPLPITPDK